MNNLNKKFNAEIVPAMMKEFAYKNVMQVPKITRVIINVGVGKFLKEPNYIENVEKNILLITGQKPVRTKSKKAISNFKLRENTEIGVMVTLRGPLMYDFLEKLLSITFPRVRDFRGISDKSFDKQGNYNLGFKDNIAFPEIPLADMDKVHGMQVVIATSAKNISEGRALLKNFGFPFAK